jgi:hypothetical protein
VGGGGKIKSEKQKLRSGKKKQLGRGQGENKVAKKN